MAIYGPGGLSDEAVFEELANTTEDYTVAIMAPGIESHIKWYGSSLRILPFNLQSIREAKSKEIAEAIDEISDYNNRRYYKKILAFVKEYVEKSQSSPELIPQYAAIVKRVYSTILKLKEKELKAKFILSLPYKVTDLESIKELEKKLIPIEKKEIDKTRLEQIIEKISVGLTKRLISPVKFIAELTKYTLSGIRFGIYNQMMRTIGSSLQEERIDPQTGEVIRGREDPFFGFLNPTRTMNKTTSFACMIGSIPIPHAQSIEVARSGKVLKFRATGSVFLANQEGGEDGITVRCKLIGSENIILLFLWFLHLYTRGKVKEMPNPTELVTNTFYILRQIKDIISANPKLQKPSYEFHHTFPFVSRHVIVSNCYIETLSFERSMEKGMEVLDVSILMRTFTKPSNVVQFNVSDEMAFLGDNSDKSTNFYRIVEFFANSAWRLINSQGYIIDETEWKYANTREVVRDVNGEITRDPVTNEILTKPRDDVYYDVDAESVAITSILGIIGMGGVGLLI